MSAAATFATAITWVLFFTRGERFRKINDSVSVVQMLFMLSAAIGVYFLFRSHDVVLVLHMTAAGVISILVAVVLQVLLVLSILNFKQSFTAGLKGSMVLG